MLKFLQDIRVICNFFTGVFGVTLATLVVKDGAAEWQFVMAVIVLCFLVIAVFATLLGWLIAKAAVSAK